MDFNDLLRRAGLTADELKKKIPLEWVVARAGILLERQPDGRLTGFCPFHLDQKTPNFAVFGDKLERCGCWACDFRNGDLYDFIMRFWEISTFPEAIEKTLEFLRDFEADEEWTASPPPHIEPIPRDRLAEVCRRAYVAARDDLGAIAKLVQAKELPVDPKWLHNEFHIGVLDGETVLIPHLSWDTEKSRWEVSGYKTRIGIRHPFSASGSKLIELYGAWRDQGRPHIIITEGESDTWTVAWYYRNNENVDVVGLPSGASAVPRDEWITRFKNREVTLVFDGDRAGRDAARRWWDALRDKTLVTRVAGLEDGTDASTCADINNAIEQALTVPLWNAIVTNQNGRYTKMTRQGPVPVSNWTLDPERLVVADGKWHAVEGKLPDGRVAVITASDLESELMTTRWANTHGYSWYGTKRDSQAVLELLQYEGPFLARGRSTNTAGFHEGHFVLPELTIGPQHWVYVPPVADVGLRDKIHVREEECDPQVFWEMTHLHQREVICPIIAWVAAAPLRSLMKFFPPLGVVGGSGFGKSTMVEEVLYTFGWKTQMGLTDTTPYAVHALSAATNGVPIWFDDYRLNARTDTLDALRQCLRAAWDGAAAVKGGLQSNYQALTFLPATSPIVVAGEDDFTEVSHVERMIIVAVPAKGKSPEALDRLRSLQRGGFAFMYLTWLIESWWSGTLPKAPEPLKTRPETARAVLCWGWELLERFAAEVFGTTIPVLELSAVRREAEEALPPMLDALIWGLDQTDRQGRPIAWRTTDNKLCVRVRELVMLVRRENVLPLPGGERAVVRWLQGKFQGKMERTAFGRALVMGIDEELAIYVSDNPPPAQGSPVSI